MNNAPVMEGIVQITNKDFAISKDLMNANCICFLYSAFVYDLLLLIYDV